MYLYLSGRNISKDYCRVNIVCSSKCRIGQRYISSNIRLDESRKMMSQPHTTTNTTRHHVRTPIAPNAPNNSTNQVNYINLQNQQRLLRHKSFTATTLLSLLLFCMILLQRQAQPQMISITAVQAASYSVALTAKDTDCYVFRVPQKPVTIRYVNYDYLC